MEPRRFDALTQALTQATDQTPTRRSLLAILAGGLLATGALGASETAVKGKKRKKKKKGGGNLGAPPPAPPETATHRDDKRHARPT